jgi:hypothetical protein
MKKYLFGILFIFFFSWQAYSQTLVDFSTIPKKGTIMIFAHQDDDLIWFLPFWDKCEKFILGAVPSTSTFEEMISKQQTYLNSNNTGIDYESNWIHPWSNIPHQSFIDYYWNNNQSYNYLANDHLTAFWNDVSPYTLTRNEINKIKAKIEPYIADTNTKRIITHNNWGEYGHQHHDVLGLAVRELAIKYHKDVWMLGCTIDADNTAKPDYRKYIDITVPDGVTYTKGNFNATLYTGLRNIYNDPLNDLWTWNTTYTPSGEHNFIKIVDAGNDKSGLLYPGLTPDPLGPPQGKPGAYIFNGVDDYLTVPGNNYSSFTFSMWVRPDVIKQMDISKMAEYPASASCDRSFHIESDGKVTARIFGNNQSQTISTLSALSAGNWAHIVMTGNGSSLRIYFNGVLQGEIQTGATYSAYSTPEFVIGQAQETASFFKGQISDVRLYDYILTDDEIFAFNSANPPVAYTITAKSGVGGTISSTGAIIMNQGTDRVYTITPENFYHISAVKVDNISVGAVSSYSFNNITANHTISVTFAPSTFISIALNKPVFCSPEGQNGNLPKYANDADTTNNKYWQAIGYPKWWMVDLGINYDVAKIVIRNYVDSHRYYKYEIWASSSDTVSTHFTKIAEKTNNNLATDAGDSYYVTATARYLKVIMTFNSENTGVHISDFRVAGIPHISTWTGTTSSNWYDITNWSGEVPNSSRNVVIPNVSNNPLINASAACNNLTIDASAKLEIAPTGNLTINGILTNNSGIAGLVIKSNASGTGSLIENSGAVATVERYMANDWHWHLLSSPVANQNIWPQFAPAPTPTQSGSMYTFPASPWNWDFYYYNPNVPSTDPSWVNLRKNSAGDYNDGLIDAGNSNAGFKDAANTFPAKFESGRGYLVAYSNGWNNGSSEIHSFSGALNSGTITRTIVNNSNGSAFNLVGNPYPSSIDWDLADGSTSWGRSGALAVSGQGYDYWVWDDANARYLYRNSFSHLGNAGQYIEPGQGFFVQAATNPTALTFGNDIRTYISDKGWFKSAPTTLNTIRLKLSTEANSYFDEMFVDFNTDYTGLEGTKKIGSFYSDVPEIYSVKGGINYSIDRYQQISDKLTININVKCGLAGVYTLTATNISGFQLSNNVYLEDLKTGNVINLKVSNSYSFVGSPNDETERFNLSFSKTNSLNTEPEKISQVNIYSFGKDVYINSSMLNIGNCDVYIYNTLGLIVYQDRYVPSLNSIKLATLNIPGTYIVKVISRTGNTSTKIVIL